MTHANKKNRFSTALARDRLKDLGYTRFDSKLLVDTVAAMGILADFFDKDGVGAHVEQERSAEESQALAGGQGVQPVQSYKERLKAMQAKAAAVAPAHAKKKRKKKR